MKILHLVHQYPPDYVGGTEHYTQTVARALAERGHDVSVFYRRSAPGRGRTRRLADGVDVWAAWDGVQNPTRRFMATFGDRFLMDSFSEALAKTRPDLVHIEHLMGLPAQLAGAIRQRNIPLIVTLHDYWWICSNAQLVTNYDQSLCNGPRAWLNCARCVLARGGAGRLWPAAPGLVPLLAVRDRALRRVLLDAAQVIAPSPFVKEWYSAHGLSGARVLVLPHGVERPALLAARPDGEMSSRGMAGNGAFRVAYIGGLAPQKGVHVLVRAFNEAFGQAEMHHPELWIAGNESSDPAYSRHLRSLAGPGVRFLGLLDRQKVWQCLAQVDVLGVPSLWHETFSIVAHEALVAKLPVIASRLGALPEAIRDGVNGLLVSPGDISAWSAALQHLAGDPAYRQRLREGIQPPKTIKEHVDRLEAIYAKATCRA
jgi:glycosyltransferase involved in cell wall biosynthesis